MKEIVVSTTVIRHHPQLSRLVTIPPAAVAPWKLTGTTVVEGTINETPLGRRWNNMTASQQRMLREEILAAKSSAARPRRAEKWLTRSG